MNSKHEANSTSDQKNKTKRSLTADYIARNVEDPDSDISHDGTPRSAFKDDDEPITEPNEKKRKEEDVSHGIKEKRGKWGASCENELRDHHGKRRPVFHDSSSDEEKPKKTKGETSNKNGMSSNNKSKLYRDHHGKYRESFHDSEEEENQ